MNRVDRLGQVGSALVMITAFG